MSLITELQQIGLSDKEARVYLATLELGQSSVQQIAKKSGVNRATTYVILESLMKQGLCSTYDEDKKTLYVASNPEALNSIFTRQQKEIEERQIRFNAIVNDLNLITNRTTDKPVVKFFDGKQGILNANLELYKSYQQNDKEPSRLMYPQDKIKSVIPVEEREKFRKIRLDKKVKSKVICTSSQPVVSTTDGDRLRIDSKKFPISNDISIYGDHVIINSLGKRLSAVLIKDKEIANTLKTLFDLAWESANQHKLDK